MDERTTTRPFEITFMACIDLCFGVALIYVFIPNIEMVKQESVALLGAIPGLLLIVVGYGLFRLRKWARIGGIVVPMIVVSPLIYLVLISLVGHLVPAVYPADPRLRNSLSHASPINAFLFMSVIIFGFWRLFRYLTSKKVRLAFGIATD